MSASIAVLYACICWLGAVLVSDWFIRTKKYTCFSVLAYNKTVHQAKILAFVGMPGAGKGTCTEYISRVYAVPVIHFGNMMYEEVQRRGLDNVKDEKFVREDMRAT